MVPAHSHRVSRVPWYSGSRSVRPDFTYGAFTLSGRSFQFRSVILPESFLRSEPRSARTPVWALSGSLAATSEITVVFFSSGYLDVSVHRVPLRTLWIHVRMHKVFLCGFPHSDICGSKGMCPSPQLFAAYHVFHRLSVPRHPPCAFSCLTLLRPDHCLVPHGFPLPLLPSFYLYGSAFPFVPSVALLGGCCFCIRLPPPAFRLMS